MALAFLPVVIIRMTFQTLLTLANPILTPLFTYFHHQWWTATPTAMWNVYGADLRTNNHCEGWHVRFSNSIGRHPLNIYQVVKAMQDEQSSMQIMQQQIIAGRIARRVDNRYIRLEKRLKCLKERCDSGRTTAIEYITGMSHNLAERG